MNLSRWKAVLPFTAVPLGTFGIWLVIALVVIATLWRERGNELGEVQLDAKATTTLLQAHTVNTFLAVNIALGEIVKTLEREKLPRHDEGFRRSMRERLPAMPYVRALYVIGPDGHIVHDTDYPTTPDVSLADRAYFRGHQSNDSLETSISAPIQSRSGVGWFVAASRRVGGGGEFRGVAVAAIQLRYFSDLYQQIGLGEGTVIALFHRDGRLLVQHPAEGGEVGGNYTDAPLFRSYVFEAPSGLFRTEGGALPFPRIVSYANVPGYPLVVAVAQNIDVRLKAWRRIALWTGVALLLLLVSMMFGSVQYVRFVTQRERVRARLQQAEKMEALGLLTGGVAHDFGNLLNIVKMNLQLIHKSCAENPSTAAALGRAQRAVDNGALLTQQLMSFSRKRELVMTDADLNEVLQGCFPLLRQAAGSQIELSFEPTPQVDSCKVDRTPIETALINLVVNARHAIDGAGRIRLSTQSVVREGGELAAPGRGTPKFVCVTVEDNGRGMTEAVRRRALEPFFTTKGEQGTGLGLAQIYGYMQQIGGETAIESKVGVGTKVRLYFPIS